MTQQSPPVTCYRHPDRQTGRRCTRCGRPACPECLQEASVGSHCVDCVKDAAPSTRQRLGVFTRNENMLATKLIVGVTVAAFVIIGLRDANFDGTGHWADNLVLFGPLVHQGEWWRIFTVSFVHAGHPAPRSSTCCCCGSSASCSSRAPARCASALIYVVSVAAGSAAVLLVQPHVADRRARRAASSASRPRRRS